MVWFTTSHIILFSTHGPTFHFKHCAFFGTTTFFCVLYLWCLLLRQQSFEMCPRMKPEQRSWSCEKIWENRLLKNHIKMYLLYRTNIDSTYFIDVWSFPALATSSSKLGTPTWKKMAKNELFYCLYNAIFMSKYPGFSFSQFRLSQIFLFVCPENSSYRNFC